jgi:serine protease Do
MKKRFLIFTAAALSLVLTHAVPPAGARSVRDLEDTFVSVSEKVGPAVVTISVVQVVKSAGPKNQQNLQRNPYFDDFLEYFFRGRPGREFKQKGLGSGFIISEDGYILTNEHVVGEADEIEVTLPDGRDFEAEFVGSDSRSDIALIKIDGENLPFVKLGNSDEVKPGHWCIAMGNPFGHIVNNPNPTITTGIVSAIHRTLAIHEADRFYGDLIQTDAAINQGNSGGPLLNLDGEVIGISTLIFSPTGGSVGIGFAIPINRGKAILEDLISGREIKHGWLGIWLQNINREIVTQFGLPGETTGSLIFQVEKGSPAEEAGFRSGDIIYEIDGESVSASSDVSRIISSKRPGEEVTVKIYRDKQPVTIKVTIGEKQKSPARRRQELRKASEWRGMRVGDLTEEIARKLKLKSDRGVVITRIAYGSAAYKARLVPGDIIYSVARKPVNTVEQFIQATRDLEAGDVLIQTSRGYVVVPGE